MQKISAPQAAKKLDINPTPKQFEAWQALADPNIAEIHYGGAAGGGKSWLGCESRLVRALAYPGYKSFVGRNELTRLMASAYITFQKVCTKHGLTQEDWHFNGKYNYIEFSNGSRIDLLDLSFKPSDPMFERLGSLEYTDGWVEEAGEVSFMAVDILRARIGRHRNTEFSLNPDLLYTYNPNKGWVYQIYKQYRDKTLPKDTVFIQAFYDDNPYTRDLYGKQLDRIKDPAMRARLKLGLFEYDDDPTALVDYDAVIDMFTNTVEEGSPAITVDVARHGVDKTVIYVWEGFKLVAVRIYQRQDTHTTSEKLKVLAQEFRVPYSRIMADEDGIGGAVVDNVRGIRGFIANAPAAENMVTQERPNYMNHKAQCSYELADYINAHKLAVSKDVNFRSEVPAITYEIWKQMLIEEIEQIKTKNEDKDGKRQVAPKESVKEALGRSPDFSDTMMMRMAIEHGRSVIRSAVTHLPSRFRNSTSSNVTRVKGFPQSYTPFRPRT